MGNGSAVLRMSTTGTAAFVVSEATCHSILSLPVNLPFNLLSGERLLQLQDNLRLIKFIIIYEVSIIGKKCCILLTKDLIKDQVKWMSHLVDLASHLLVTFRNYHQLVIYQYTMKIHLIPM